ncbi:unnamed protein product, partial [Polarella glacialis]
MATQNWQAEEAATFISELCELPQYALTFQRNLSIRSLLDLRSRGALTKGLCRAGIFDLGHQRRINAELGSLEAGMPPEVLDGSMQLLRSSSSGFLASIAAQTLLSSQHKRQAMKLPAISRSISVVSDPTINVGSPPRSLTANHLLV